MHRLKVSLLCLISMSLAGSVFGQTAPQPDSGGVATYDSYSGGATMGSGTYFNARYMSGDGVGYQQGYSQIGAFVPFWLGDNALIAPDVRLMLTNYSGVGGNIGGVARNYFESIDRIVGAAAYFDMDQSANRNNYTQGTFGLETLGQYWDLRGNYYYVPGTQDKFVSTGNPLCVSGNPFFSGNNIVFQGQQGLYREQAMSGFDLEFGMPVFQSTPWLRAYAGTYYYKANQVAPPMSVNIPNQTDSNPWGFRGRLDAWIADDLLVGVNVTTDSVWGTNVNGVVDFRFSGFRPTRYFPQWTTRERMLAPWQRNWRIAVEQYQTAQNTDVVAINPNTGKPYFITFVNGDNTTAGTGTFEDPFKSFDHPNGIPGADIIYVARDGSTAANPYIGTMKLFDNQILLGEGGTMKPLALSASYGQCSVNGNFTLPGVDGSGNYPWVSSPGGHAIGLANNNEVSGFHIINSVDGIVGTNINNADLRNLDIHGNSGRGINLTNVGGTVNLLDVNSSSNGTGIFLSETNKTLVTNFLNVTASGNTGRGVDVSGTGGSVTLNATDPTQPLIANNNGGNNLNVGMTGGTFLGNFVGSSFNGSTAGSGVGYSQAGGTGTLNLTNVTANGNGIDGITQTVSGGGATLLNTNGSQFNSNTRDGIHTDETGGSTVTNNILSSLLNSNGRDGYFYNLAGNSTLNGTFTSDFLNSNQRSGFFGLMNDSTATFNISNTQATNSRQNSFALDATAGSFFTGTIANTDLSSSQLANGMNVTLHGGSTATFGLTSVTDNNNAQNGVSFLTDNSTFSLTALSSNFNTNNMNGIIGTAQNGAAATVDLGNSSVSGNAQSGVFVTTTSLASVTASFANTAINNNAAGDGVHLSMDNSPNSTLSMTGTTTLNNNGANGLLIDATTNTVFTPTLDGTTITGNGQDGIHVNVASGSTVGSAATPGTLTNVTATGNTGNGIDLNVTGAGSTSTLQLTNFNGGSNTQSNAAVNVSQGGFLNLMTTGSNFSDSATGAGVDATVTGVNSVAYLDFDNAHIDRNATVGLNGVVNSTSGAALNVCLDDSTVSNNTLQGINVAATGAGATASFGVGQFNQNNGSTVAFNGSEGVLANAIAGGTINFREFDSHFDNNGQTVASDGMNFGANAGTIRTLFYGGSADNNSRNGVRVGPIEPNASSFGSDLTVSLANGFSGSNNAQYGLVLDGAGANSANLLQDPNTPPAVFTGNGVGSQNLNFSGVNQVVLQELGSFDNMAGDGAHFVFSNINTAIISFNGLGTGTINNNGQNGLFVQMNNVKNGSVLIGGYTDISGNGADGIHIEMNGNSAANPMNAAVQIDGVAGNTNMAGNGANAVNIQLLNANLVNNFTSLPGVSLTILTPTSNDSLNACIPLPVSQAGGLGGITPTTALNIHNLNITNSTNQGIVVNGTQSTIADNGGSISNNIVSGSLGGDGISVTLTEPVAPTLTAGTTGIANGFKFDSNTVTGNSGNGINFGVTNTAVSSITSANNLTFTNNSISTNGGNGINLAFTNPAGSTAAVNNFSFTGDTINGNTGNGVAVSLSGITVASTMTNETLTNNTGDGLLAILTGTGTANQTSGDFTLSGSTVTGNGINGAGFTANNAAHLGVNLLSNTLIDSNTVDGVRIDATGANTTVSSTITTASLTNNGVGGTGNGLTGNFDNGATGVFTIDSSTFGNTAVGGTQINGLDLNVNQTTAAAATNVSATITNTTFNNNAASGIAGNITGTNGPINPTTGAELTLDTVTVSGNGVDGIAFDVNKAALLQMSVDVSSVTNNGHNGMYINANDVNTLVALDMTDSGFNNNGSISFPGDGFNATISTGATLNVCAETSISAVTPMSFSGNAGDGFDVQVNDPNSRADIDFHSVIAGASAADGLLGNTLNGVSAQAFDGGDVNLRAYTTKFDGNGGAGLFGAATNTISDPSTIARFRIIGGEANGNTGDGFQFIATNTAGAPTGGTELTAQFQADDFGTGISAQNNGGYGLEYTTSTPGGGINANLLMTGGSQLLNNGAGTLNVNMAGADQVIIGLSGTFDGSTTGDGIHIDLEDITGLALVSLQGPGEVRNNAGDGIDVLLKNVAQGGVFIGGFTDVSNNGTGNNALIGQDGIKVAMDNVALGAVTIDSQTATLPANIMNVSNNTGNGVNVSAINGSVINNTAFNAILGAKLVNVIDYTAPDAPCPTPLPNPLLTIVPVNASTALGITFQPNLAIQNLNVDNNGNATAGNLSGDGIVVTVDSTASVLAPLGTAPISINNNIITNTGSTSSTGTHDGIVLQVLGNGNVTTADIVTNDIEGNNGNGINVIANLAPTLASLNIANNTILNQTGTLGATGNGIVLQLTDAAALAQVTVNNNDVEGNKGDGFQMLNPNTGVNLNVDFTLNKFIANGSIVPPSATSTFPPGGMGIDVVLNNLNAIQTTVNVLSNASGVNTISNNASFGLFLQATNQALYNLNVTGTGAANVFDANTDAGIAIVGGSFVNPSNSLDPTKFSVGNVLINNVNVTNTIAGSHPSLPNYPFKGDGIGVLLQQYAQMNSFVIGTASPAARNTTLANNAGDGLRINAIEQSQFRHTQADGITPITTLGQATILLEQINATNNGANGIDIIRRDNALLSWDDQTVNAGAALFNPANPVSWQAITDGGSFIHINDVIATGNGVNGLNVSTTNAQFPITRIDIKDSNPVAMGYNPKTVGHSVYDLNNGRGMQFTASADSILVVNAQDTSASDNLQGGILVQTFNRATFGDVLTATPLGDPTSDNSIRSTFNGMLISGNGRSNSNVNAAGFEVQANGGSDPGNVSSSSVVNISMTGTATNARNLFDSNGGDDFKVTANRFSENYFNLNRIDMRDTAFVHLGSDGLHVQTNESSFTQVDLTNASIGYPTASSTQTGLSGDGIDVQTTGGSSMVLNVGNTLALNRFGGGIAAGAADPTNAPDVSIYGNKLNGIVIRNQGGSNFVGSVFDTASRFNGNRGYSAEMQDGNGSNFYAHQIDHSLFSDNSFEGIAVIGNSRSQSGRFVDIPSLFTTNPAFQNGYLLYNFLNQQTVLNSSFILTNSTVSNNGSATPYVNTTNNVNGLEIDVSTRSKIAADIRNNTFHGNTLDDVATASFQASTGGFNANGTISTVGLLNTPGSIDEVTSGVDRIFLEDTAQLDMRFMQNVGDQIHVSSAGSNNPNMNANGAHRTDPNTKFNPSNEQGTALFQVNAFHYDTVASVVSNNNFTGANVQPIDVASGNTVQDTPNFPGSITQPGNVIATRNLQAAILNIANIYTNTNAAPTNPSPTAFTQVRIDDITQGTTGTGANGVIGYTAGGQFTMAGAGVPGVAVNDVFRIHLLDTNTFNQFGVAQNVEAAFSNGFAQHLIRSAPGQLAGNAGTFIPTNPLAPYFTWPSPSFPPF